MSIMIMLIANKIMLFLEIMQSMVIVMRHSFERSNKVRDVRMGADRSSHLEYYMGNSVCKQKFELQFPQLLIFSTHGTHIIFLKLH